MLMCDPFFAFFLELPLVLQKRIIFIKGLQIPNAKLSYTAEGTIAESISHMAF